MLQDVTRVCLALYIMRPFMLTSAWFPALFTVQVEKREVYQNDRLQVRRDHSSYNDYDDGPPSGASSLPLMQT